MGREVQGSDYPTLSQALGIGERPRTPPPLLQQALGASVLFCEGELVSAHLPLTGLLEPQEEVGETLWRSTHVLRPHEGLQRGLWPWGDKGDHSMTPSAPAPWVPELHVPGPGWDRFANKAWGQEQRLWRVCAW